jgi:ketosteroid isomerase-like protein
MKKTSQPLVQIINNNAAVISFAFEAEMTGLDGTKMNETGALTYVWNNINGKWKIVHIHKSPKMELK